MVLTAHGLADGFGIGRIVLVALYVRFDIAGRHQAHIMPATGDLSRPEVGGAAALMSTIQSSRAAKKAATWAPAQPSG